MVNVYLLPHPTSPEPAVTSLSVTVERTTAAHLQLDYRLEGELDALRIEEFTALRRADRLWEHTCFELFAKPTGGEGYFEFNFSPSFQWAAYAFDGYRSGMRELSAEDPEIAVTPEPPHFFLAVEAMPLLPPVAMQIGLSAVIEETDGTKSYWAPRHPPGKPDFHHPDCFALELPAPERT